MFVRNAAALLLAIGLQGKDALAELITITQYASTCSAIYTTGSRSVTIVQSTTTVVPVPYNDAAWNSGTPFVLEVEPDSTNPLARRQDGSLVGRSWVTVNGNTSTIPSMAAQYYIRGGQLMTINGSYVSTNLNVESQSFYASITAGSISTAFTFKDGVLNWTSPRFTGGRARFCKTPANLVDNAQVQCTFLGASDPPQSCTPIRLAAKPCEEVNPISSSSAAPTGTIGVSTSMGMQSMSSMPIGPPDQYSPPAYTYQPVSSSSGVAGPSASTPPPPYIGSSSSRSLPLLSTPAVYTSVSLSGASSYISPAGSPSRSSSSGAMTSSSPNNPPIYGSVTPSATGTPSSVSSSPGISFASSGSPLGPLNPPIYGSTSSDSSSSSSSVSISSGGVRSSASSTSSASSIGLPPVQYPSQTPPSSSMAMSTIQSSISPSSSYLSTSLPPSISFASSVSRPPGYTLPAVTPVSETPSAMSSSQSPPPFYPGGSSTSSSTVSSPSASAPPTYGFPAVCPANDGQVISDASGVAYTVHCSSGPKETGGNGDSVVGASSSFNDCFAACDQAVIGPDSLPCTGFTYAGGANGVGSGICYLKTGVSYTIATAPNTNVGAVRQAGSPPSYSVPASSAGSASVSASQAPSSVAIITPIYSGSPPVPCPEGNNTVYIDGAGYAYTIYCQIDSQPTSYGAPLDLSFANCIQRCDLDPQCGAVTHTGERTCYLKPTPQTYYQAPAADLKLAVRMSGNPSYSGAPSMMSSTPGSSSMPMSSSSMMASSSMTSSSSTIASVRPPLISLSIGPPPVQYEQTTTSSSSSPASTTSSSLSSSVQVPDQYGQTTTSSSSTSSAQAPDQHAQTTTSSSSSSIQIPDQYAQTTTSSSSSSIQIPDQYPQATTSSSSSSVQVPDQYAQTSTSSASSSSSSAASSTIPYSSYLVLPSPTPCNFGDPPDYDEDDSYCEVDLPFQMQVYGTSSARTFPSSNGYVGLNRGSSQYQISRFPYTGIPENSIAPFFDDLALYGKKNPRQGIYYQISGTSVTYEWYIGRSAQDQPDKDRLSQSIYHFTLAYDSAVPNTFIYTYYAVGSTAQADTGAGGTTAAVGLQGLDASGQAQGQTYSFRQGGITPGTQVSCSGLTNSCTRVVNPVIAPDPAGAASR